MMIYSQKSMYQCQSINIMPEIPDQKLNLNAHLIRE